LKRTFAETVGHICLVLTVIFIYTAGTHVFIVLASLDCTCSSSVYVLSKAGLFSTKYHILPEFSYSTR